MDISSALFSGRFRKVRRGFREPERPAAGTEQIGIAGSGPSVGVTHFAFLTAAYLTGVLNSRTAVLEWNDSGDFARMEAVRSKKTVTDPAGKSFNSLGIFYYKKAGREELLACSGHEFDTVVIDFGMLRDENRDEFLRCGRRFLVGSASQWQLPALAGLVSEGGNHIDGCEYFSVFGDEETLKMAEHFLGIRIRQIPLSRNAFVITGETLAFFGRFLK